MHQRRRDRSATMQCRAIDAKPEYRVHMHCTRYYVSILARSSLDPVAPHRADTVSGACGRASVHAPTRPQRDDAVSRDRCQTGISSAYALHTILCVDTRPLEC